MKVPPVKIDFPPSDRKRILSDIENVIVSGRLTLGEYCKNFESMFSKFLDRKYGIAVNSGTSAIEIAIRCLNLKNKKIIVPTNTFYASAGAVVHAGAKVKFIDADEKTFSLDVDKVNELVDRNTNAVLVVHIGGIITPRIRELANLCKDLDIFLIEDAAHAHGSSYKNIKAGNFGKAAGFSFYPTKVITSGEGGMIVTDDPEIDEKSRIFRDQGKSGFLANYHVELGYNWRMSELHAILGIYQLKRLNEFIEKRRKIASIYDKKLRNMSGIKLLEIQRDVYCNYYKYIVMIDENIDRKKIKTLLKEKFNVFPGGEVYDTPCHLQPIFKKMCRHKEGDFPIAEYICKNHICLPVYPSMKTEEVDYVVESLKSVLEWLQ